MTEGIERYRGLAARWAAYEDASMLVRDEASEMGWSVAVELSDAELAELLGWVRAEMEREVDRRAAACSHAHAHCDTVICRRDVHERPPCDACGDDGLADDDREALAHAIMTKLGWETLGGDPHGEHGLAWLLCEAAGWPEVSS